MPDEEFHRPSLKKRLVFIETRFAFGRLWVQKPRGSENIFGENVLPLS